MRYKRIESSSGQAASALRQAIISGELLPGTRLREVELSESLGVSRSPIREAFRILEPEGLIHVSPNKGASVAQFGEEDLREIYELRMLLEGYAVRIGCKHLDAKDLNDARAIMVEMERSLKSKDYTGYLKISHEFHECYVKRCGNQRLINWYRIMRNSILAIQIFAYSYHEHSSDSLREHKLILSALIKRDVAEAEEYVKRHLEAGYERAKKYFKKKT